VAETLDQIRYLETLLPLVVVVVERASTKQARTVDLVVVVHTKLPQEPGQLIKDLMVARVAELLAVKQVAVEEVPAQ
jgi:hypothetical protein